MPPNPSAASAASSHTFAATPALLAASTASSARRAGKRSAGEAFTRSLVRATAPVTARTRSTPIASGSSWECSVMALTAVFGFEVVGRNRDRDGVGAVQLTHCAAHGEAEARGIRSIADTGHRDDTRAALDARQPRDLVGRTLRTERLQRSRHPLEPVGGEELDPIGSVPCCEEDDVGVGPGAG